MIPLGLSQPRYSRTFSLSLLESNPWVLLQWETKKATLLELLFCDPAGIVSAPLFPHTFPEPSRIEPLGTPPMGNKKSNSFEVAFL